MREIEDMNEFAINFDIISRLATIAAAKSLSEKEADAALNMIELVLNGTDYNPDVVSKNIDSYRKAIKKMMAFYQK